MDSVNPDVVAPLLARAVCPTNASPQIISLDARTWRTVDWLVADMGENLQQMTDYCWHYFQKHPDLDYLSIFHHYVAWSAANASAEIYGLANNNYLTVWNDWDAKPEPFEVNLSEEDLTICGMVLREIISRYETYVAGHLKTQIVPRPIPANDNETGRNDVWEKPPHPYRITLAKKLSFLAG